MRIRPVVACMVLLPMFCVTGCGQTATDVVRVMHTSYDAANSILTISARHVHAKGVTGEQYININDTQSLAHYATYAAPDQNVREVIITGIGSRQTRVLPPPPTGTDNSGAGAMVYRQGPVPGVRWDPQIRPKAGASASLFAKEQAVMQVAKSKMGTPYIWGHNEDRGQYGFDCSNFTAYVYHHALGYKMSGSSLVQYHSVGIPVARRNARVGDLIIFEKGKHVGIYAGHDRVLQEGGGLGKVGYIGLGPGSYWGHHITEFKRMF